MKNLFLLLLLIPVITFAQQDNSKTSRATITVLGECEMCKDRIEKATFKIKGVKYSNWSIPKNQLSIIYNSNKTSLDNIKKKIDLDLSIFFPINLLLAMILNNLINIRVNCKF